MGAKMALLVDASAVELDDQRSTLLVHEPIDMPSHSGWIPWYLGGTSRHFVKVVMHLVLALWFVAVQVAGRRRTVSAFASLHAESRCGSSAISLHSAARPRAVSSRLLCRR